MQIFSSALRDRWNAWELPTMLLFSLLLQLVLIPMGFMRKYSSKNWPQLLLWFAYLAADWVATVSLGILTNDCGGDSPDSRNVIRAFWAPFLLLHLGGPDTVTAYSMQDNDLWLRHLLGLLVQAGLAFYVFLRALQPTYLNFVAIPVFVAGIIKYGERTWVLRSACSEHLRDRLVSASYFSRYDTKCMPRHLSFPIRITDKEVIIYNNLDEQQPPLGDLQMLHIAHCFFERNKRLFADLVMSTYDLQRSLHYFEMFDSERAFRIIELELGFMYDFFYTKASVIHSRWGAALRLTSLFSILIAIIFYMSKSYTYPLVDVAVTIVLLVGALGLEIYSIVLLMRSDWSVIRLTKSSNSLAHLTFKWLTFSGWSVKNRRWSNSVLQYNLITHCLRDHKNGGYCKLFLRSSYITKTMAASRKISDELKKRIFKQLKSKLEVDEDSRKLPGWILRERNCYDQLGWSLEFDPDQSILLWHIATDLCYYSDHETTSVSNSSSALEDSKTLSDFLTYLLVYRQSLFPNGMVQIRLDATIGDGIEFLQHRRSIETVADACRSMLDLDTRILPTDIKGDTSYSMFYHGCRLAQELLRLEGLEIRWDIISHVWVELVANISYECRWYEHVEQLCHGGDLLSHVWLLMHHLGYIKEVYNLTSVPEQFTPAETCEVYNLTSVPEQFTPAETCEESMT